MAVKVPLDEIARSRDEFDLGRALTPEEVAMIPTIGQAPPAEEMPDAPRALNIEAEGATAAVSAPVPGNEYNERYAAYLKAQALLTLVGFDEGWEALREVMEDFLRLQRRADASYRGYDPHQAFALRLRRVTANDFVDYINSRISEAALVPKPEVR